LAIAKSVIMCEYVPPNLEKLDESIHEMLEDWNTLNWEVGAKVNEISYSTTGSKPIPDDILFMRHLCQNMPLVIRGAAKEWICVKKWSKEYLISKMGRRNVKVAVTPDGLADAVKIIDQSESEGVAYTLPHEVYLPFEDVLNAICSQEKQPDKPGNIFYLQQQNDTLHDADYLPLSPDVPTRTLDCIENILAKDEDPDRPLIVNFWLGNNRSTTYMHCDPYDNIVVSQIPH